MVTDGGGLMGFFTMAVLIKISILLILFFYAIFALLIVRQVDLMSRTLITPISPLIKAFSIIHAGFAIGFLVLIFGTL